MIDYIDLIYFTNKNDQIARHDLLQKDISMIRLLGLSKFCYSNITLASNPASHTAVLTLSNEKKRNPLALQTIQQIKHAFKEVEAKIAAQKLKILILKGNGPVFSAGHDLKELKASSQPKKVFQQFTETLFILKSLPIITLCAIDGVAAAAGFQLALTCDMILATQKSSFSTPGVKWGLFCSTPGVQLLRSISSQKKAKEMLLFGEPISADEAYKYGLINKVLPTTQKLNQEVESYINKACNLSGQVISLGKRIYSQQQPLDLEKAYCAAVKGMDENILTKSDCQQGLSAFIEKRHPHYKN